MNKQVEFNGKISFITNATATEILVTYSKKL